MSIPPGIGPNMQAALGPMGGPPPMGPPPMMGGGGIMPGGMPGMASGLPPIPPGGMLSLGGAVPPPMGPMGMPIGGPGMGPSQGGIPPGPGMPGLPPLGMPGMPPPPPPSSLQDPTEDEVVMAMLRQRYEREMQEQAEAEKGPFHDDWYEETKEYLYPKPDLDEMLRIAGDDQREYQSLIDRFQEDIDLLSSDAALTGTFKDFDAESEEAWYSSALVAEKNLLKAKIGGIKPIFEPKYNTIADKEKAQDVKDFLCAIESEANRQFTQSFGGDRAMAIAEHSLVYGHLVQRNLPDWKGEARCGVPFIMTLCDPATVFVHREGHRGIGRVTRTYIQPLREVFGDHPEAAKQLRSKVLRTKDDGSRVGLDDDVKVVEFWDRRWFALMVDDFLVKGPVEHDLGEPPFTYVVVERGESTATTSPGMQSARSKQGATTTREQVDRTHRGLSFMAYRKRTHAQKEATLGALYTEMRRKQNMPLIVEQDDFAMEKGMPEIVSARGGRSQTWKNHEEVKEYPVRPQPIEYGPLLQASQEDMARDAMPPSAYGINTNSNVSGYAVNELNDSGLDKMTPDLKAIERFHEANASQILRMMKNWGHLLGKKGARGEVQVPRMYPRNQSQGYTRITPWTIRQVGDEAVCKMTTISLRDMAPLANTAAILKTNKWITDEQAMVLLQLPGAEDPQQTQMAIRMQEMKDQPEFRMAEMVSFAEEQGDHVFAAFLTRQLAKGREQEQGPPGAPPGAPPGGPPGPGPQPMGGVSRPQAALPGPGPGSGPQGPVGPRPVRPPMMG